MSKLVEKLMVIRKGWNHQDFIDAYEDEWEEMPESLSDKFDKMEAHVYYTYDDEYIKEVIEDEEITQNK